MAENVRKKNYNNKKEIRQKAPDVCAGTVEYKMSRQMAEQLIGNKKGNKDPQQILCDYVNTNCGLKGYCVRVLIDL